MSEKNRFHADLRYDDLPHIQFSAADFSRELDTPRELLESNVSTGFSNESCESAAILSPPSTSGPMPSMTGTIQNVQSLNVHLLVKNLTNDIPFLTLSHHQMRQIIHHPVHLQICWSHSTMVALYHCVVQYVLSCILSFKQVVLHCHCRPT